MCQIQKSSDIRFMIGEKKRQQQILRNDIAYQRKQLRELIKQMNDRVALGGTISASS